MGKDEKPLIGRKPSPRLLLYGAGLADLRDRLSSFVPTVGYTDDLNEVNQDEWDVVVTDRPIVKFNLRARTSEHYERARVDKGLCVVGRVVSAPDGLVEQVDIDGSAGGAIATSYVVCNEFIDEYLEQAGDKLNRLAREELVPLARDRQRQECFDYSRAAEGVPNHVIPLGQLRSQEALALLYRRSPTSEALILPSDIQDLVPWVEAALWRWHDLAPARFPRLHDWREAPEWRTEDEQYVTDQLAVAEQEHQRLVTEHEQTTARLRSQLFDASDQADKRERAVLTEQGETLVAAVAELQRDLGFEVEDIDAATADHPGQKLEDLRITDPDAPGWLALVEVRGYKGGAKTSDFQRIDRFVERMLTGQDRRPDSRWYVVNQFLNQPPDQRNPVFANAAEDVAVFAESGGTVFDTIELFRAHQAVRSGQADADAVRAAMRDTTGVFTSEGIQT